MPLIYRVMTVDGKRPLVADTARGLGVRIGGGTNTDIPVSSNGDVTPNTGGMSVAPSWRDLPLHRIPHRLRTVVHSAAGNDKDACWRMGEGPFVEASVADGLMLRPDRKAHGNVEPIESMSLVRYRGLIAATREMWEVDES
jgi:hypothetical protein